MEEQKFRIIICEKCYNIPKIIILKKDLVKITALNVRKQEL